MPSSHCSSCLSLADNVGARRKVTSRSGSASGRRSERMLHWRERLGKGQCVKKSESPCIMIKVTVQVVFYVGVQLDVTKRAQPCEASAAADNASSQPEILPGEPSGKDLVAQKGVCGAVRVACRGLCPSGLRRSSDYQCPLRPSLDSPRYSAEVSIRLFTSLYPPTIILPTPWIALRVCRAVRMPCRGLCPGGLRRALGYRCPLRPSLDSPRYSAEVSTRLPLVPSEWI